MSSRSGRSRSRLYAEDEDDEPTPRRRGRDRTYAENFSFDGQGGVVSSPLSSIGSRHTPSLSPIVSNLSSITPSPTTRFINDQDIRMDREEIERRRIRYEHQDDRLRREENERRRNDPNYN